MQRARRQLVSAASGRLFARRFQADASRAAIRLPSPGESDRRSLPGTDLDVPGLSTFITPNDAFYRVDTALLVPSVKAEDWQLRIHGMVEREMTLTFDELMARPLIERDVTLTCVSNEVGGRYIGNARWLGAPFKDLLDEVGVDPSADQLVSRSSTDSRPAAQRRPSRDGRDAMLALAMNGEALPIAHGFPVRMIVPGLYGYVSATKWITDIELTTFDAFDAYWVRRGWAQQAVIKTESRIDTPTSQTRLVAGPSRRRSRLGAASRDPGGRASRRRGTVDAGETLGRGHRRHLAAMAGDVGRDGGTTPAPGAATDRTGAVQAEATAPPFPDGATGYHSIVVQVS